MPCLEVTGLTAAELKRMGEQDAMIIIPVGSMEQHGPHLPVMVDTRLATEVAMRTARKLTGLGETVLVAPAIWAGVSEHHMAFGGTISLRYAAFQAMAGDVIRSLARDGFRRICLLNGHGGNTAPLTVLVSELTPELKIPLVSFTYWEIAGAAIREILEQQEALLHACEAETSMMMALEPRLVQRDHIAAAHCPDQEQAEVSNLVGPGVFRWQTIEARSRSGVIGNPATSTAEKGARLLDAISNRAAAILGTAELWSVRSY
ncbi:MAG: creatininase family protein [Acetobacteraceae bacterium]